MDTELADVEAWLDARPPGPEPAKGRFRQGAVLGEWRIEAYLGRGCSAEVYRVVNVRTGREGAMKLLVSEDGGIRDRFLVEMDTLRFLQSGAFPTFYGSGVSGGNPYYVMEYLQPFLFPLPRRDVPRFMVAVAKAVQLLHNAGYVHRDLKPSNILRRSNGQPVLIDPGLVKKMDKADAQTRPSALSIVNGRPIAVGTIDYAAPEQMLKGIASARSDVFSLGKVLAACFEEKPKGPWLAIIRRATQESPDDRYASADDFARAIRRRHWPNALRLLLAFCVVSIISALLLVPPNAGEAEPMPPEVVEVPADPESLLKLPDETEAAHLARLLPMAHKDNVAAQLLVAEAYFYGRGTETNRVEAVEWYERAAIAENHDAEASLGLCYLYGYGCEKDPEIAVEWFLRAAEAGNTVAMTNLAFCYLNGRGIDVDKSAAADWARRAAERGHAPGQVMLAECYLSGQGVERNDERAKLWLQAAARQGNRRAKMLLETLGVEIENVKDTGSGSPPSATGQSL